MANPCASHGGSKIISGAGTNVILTAAGVELALQKAGINPASAALSMILAGVTYDLTTLCSNDPPADPGLTAQDLLDALNFTDPFISIPAIQKAYNWFKSWYWYLACECVDNTAPTIVAPSNPGNPISINSGTPAGTVTPCWSFAGNVTNTGLSGSPLQTLANQFLPGGVSRIVTFPTTGFFFAGGQGTAFLLPAGGVQSMSMTATLDRAVTGGEWDVDIWAFDSNGAILSSEAWGVRWTSVSQLTQTATKAAFGASVAYWLFGVTGDAAEVHSANVTFSFQCPGGGTIQSSCCPPDPTLSAQVAQILGLLQSLYAGTPTPANSYANATVHLGLSGNGTITLAHSVLGVKVDITTDSPNLGVDAGSPTFLFDRGFIVPVVNSAPIRAETRLVYNPQTFLLPRLTEQIGYSLHPGIVVSITELVAGP